MITIGIGDDDIQTAFCIKIKKPINNGKMNLQSDQHNNPLLIGFLFQMNLIQVENNLI